MYLRCWQDRWLTNTEVLLYSVQSAALGNTDVRPAGWLKLTSTMQIRSRQSKSLANAAAKRHYSCQSTPNSSHNWPQRSGSRVTERQYTGVRVGRAAIQHCFLPMQWWIGLQPRWSYWTTGAAQSSRARFLIWSCRSTSTHTGRLRMISIRPVRNKIFLPAAFK